MAPHRDLGARDGISFRACVVTDLMGMMKRKLPMSVIIMIISLLSAVGGAPCSSINLVHDDWRSVSSTAQPNHCDMPFTFEVGKWYHFKLRGRDSNIPTECIKNNHCGAEIPLRLDLDQPLPNEGEIINASLCGAYNVLGKYDCCVLRTPVMISVCSGVTVYMFPTPPVDRCSVAICVQDPADPQLPQSVIARTGDVHQDSSTTTATAAASIGFTTTSQGDDVHESTTTTPTDGPSDPPTSDASDGLDPSASTREAPEDSTQTHATVSNGPSETSESATTTESVTSPMSTDSTNDDTTTTDMFVEEFTTSELQASELTSGPSTDSTTDLTVTTSEIDTNNNAPPMDFQQSITDEPAESTVESTTESTDKTTDKTLHSVNSASNDTTITPPLSETSNETSAPSVTVISEAITTSDDHSISPTGDGSEEISASDDMVDGTTSQSSTASANDKIITESVSVVSNSGTQGHESTDETSSTSSSTGDVPETTVADDVTTENSHNKATLMSDVSMSSISSSETSITAETRTFTTKTSSPSPTWTPASPLLLTTTGRPTIPHKSDLIFIEVIRFVFKGNHSSYSFSSTVYNILGSFLTRAVDAYKSDSGRPWNYTLIHVDPAVVYDNMTTYVDATIQHTAREDIIKVFNKLRLDHYLQSHENLSLIAKCRSSENCEREKTQDSTETIFERNTPVFITLIIIFSICLTALLVIAIYLKCSKKGVYVAQEGDGTNLADRRRYFNVNPSPFTDEQIMKDEVAMEKGEKPDKVDNSSCNGSDLVGGDSNTWVIPLDDAPVTCPVISNEDTKL